MSHRIRTASVLRAVVTVSLVAGTLVSVSPPLPAGAANIATYDETFGFKGPAGNYAYGGDWDPTTNTILWGDYCTGSAPPDRQSGLSRVVVWASRRPATATCTRPIPATAGSRCSPCPQP